MCSSTCASLDQKTTVESTARRKVHESSSVDELSRHRNIQSGSASVRSTTSGSSDDGTVLYLDQLTGTPKYDLERTFNTASKSSATSSSSSSEASAYTLAGSNLLIKNQHSPCEVVSISANNLMLRSTSPSCWAHAYHFLSKGRSIVPQCSRLYVFAIRSKNLT